MEKSILNSSCSLKSCVQKPQLAEQVPGSNTTLVMMRCFKAAIYYRYQAIVRLFHSSWVWQRMSDLMTGNNISNFFLVTSIKCDFLNILWNIKRSHWCMKEEIAISLKVLLSSSLSFTPLLLTCSAASGSRWVSSRGTVNCIFLGLPVSMVALAVREEVRTKRRRRRMGWSEEGESEEEKSEELS